MGINIKKESIKSLINCYLEIVNSERNIKNIKYWRDAHNWNRDFWRGIPLPSKDRNGIPYTIAPDNSVWGNIFNTTLTNYYSNPYEYIEMQLKTKIWHFNNFPDNFVFTDELYIWFSVVTELSLFGSEIVFYDNKEPWIKGTVINDHKDLETMEPPDFYKSGLMPKIHEFYEIMGELADGKLKVMFPSIARGPFCMAVHMRGFENILVDMVTDPEFVHKMMRFIVDGYKKWTVERNKFTGETIKKCKLYNDEIGCPTIGPAMYDEMIFPYEKELSEYHGGIEYWHSCGETTVFINSINKLPGLDMFHVGPYTSFKEADSVFGKKTAIDICLDPNRDVLEVDEYGMREKLNSIIDTCSNNNFSIRADAFMPHGDFNFLIGKIKTWGKIAAEVLNKGGIK